MDFILKLIDNIPVILLALTSIVGSAATLFAAIHKIFGLTPNDKWDARLSYIQIVLANILAFLDRIALNPDTKAARKCKEGGTCDDSTGTAT